MENNKIKTFYSSRNIDMNNIFSNKENYPFKSPTNNLKNERTKSLFLENTNVRQIKEIKPITIESIDHIEDEYDNNDLDEQTYNFNNHIEKKHFEQSINSKKHYKNNNNIINDLNIQEGLELDFGIEDIQEIQELNFENDKLATTECRNNEVLNKISLVTINKNNKREKKSNSMTINELLKLISEKNSENQSLNNEKSTKEELVKKSKINKKNVHSYSSVDEIIKTRIASIIPIKISKTLSSSHLPRDPSKIKIQKVKAKTHFRFAKQRLSYQEEENESNVRSKSDQKKVK